MLAKVRLMLILAVCMGLLGCTQQPEKQEMPLPKPQEGPVEETFPNEEPLIENREVYSQDQPGSIVYLYVTVVKEENPELKTTTFNEINRSLTGLNAKGEDLKAKVIFQEGTAEGPKVGYLGFGETRANGTLELRGESSRSSEQKSFKLRLFDSTGFWRDQRQINLSKHRNDITRVRQKLSFDYFSQIPNMTSLRTQFVDLKIKDLTGSRPDTDFVDFGLFTQIEQPNKSFLQAHGLDRNGNLYKTVNFEFQRYPDKIKLVDDPSFNKKAFESVLENKGNDNHQKLIDMLEAVNDPAININTVLDTYFDRENYYAWLAANILMGNADTAAHNFYLYSPSNSKKFYFLPWDYDLSWGFFEEEAKRVPTITLGKWEFGISNYWVSSLHRRVFKDPKNVKQLDEEIEELGHVITKEKTNEMLKSYYPIVSKYVRQLPDLYNLPQPVEQFDKEYAIIPNQPEINKERYYKAKENPMPFYMDEPKKIGGAMHFTWDHSYDLQGDDLSYDFAVSYDPGFTRIVAQAKGLKGTEYTVPINGTGRFFWRVLVHDAKGNTSTSFDRVEVENSRYHGVKEFTVK